MRRPRRIPAVLPVIIAKGAETAGGFAGADVVEFAVASRGHSFMEVE
jgi:hypothetical protein